MLKDKDNDNKIKMEDKVSDFWTKNQIFEKSLSQDAPNGDYAFYDGPPFATGTPHYGHIVGQAMKDAIPRFFTMKGYNVDRKWGWDCHGLPIENIVEKEMDINSKKEIEELGISRFNTVCRSKVLEYSHEWYKASDKIGRFIDKTNAYHTMDLNYMESVWWVFKSLWDKDLIYKDYRSMHVCPRCETTLSQSEVAEGYQMTKDLSCVAKFPLIDQENTFILAWTTTPWTLIANTALAVGNDIAYVKVSHAKEDGSTEFYILAKEKLEEIMKDKAYEIVEEFKGEKLLSLKYKAIFDYYYKDNNLENRENAWMIYAADFVTTEEGTGIVHIAPAFGQDDMDLGKKHKLPFVQHLGIDGYFKAEVKDLPNLNVKPSGDAMSTDIEIIKYLAAHNFLFSKEKYEHSYPFCWRCDTPLINYATSSWFVAVTKIKDQLLEQAEKINWSPEHVKRGRFGNWLEGAKDWSISRQRFWASAIPIWECDSDCDERVVVGSVKELEDLSGQKIEDIHKDVVDGIEFNCSKCQGKMKRIPDVLDCWFESGSMPYAQLHYPFENKEKFEANFPAQFIAEGIDQTRAWFYYLHVISVALFGVSAFSNVIVNGIVLAEDGKKMSKKLKNYPDPLLLLDKYGADALRAYLLASPVTQAENLNFSEQGVQEAFRKNVMLINNIYNFYSTYSDDLVKERYDLYLSSENVLDKWLLSKLSLLLTEVEEAVMNYNLPKAIRPITVFIDEFSTWYLRRSRERLKSDNMDDKLFALATMRYTFLNLSKIMAPFTPFIAEEIWQKINNYDYLYPDKSVHLESWPDLSDVNVDNTVLDLMTEARQVVEMGLFERDKKGIKVRQILNLATVYHLNGKLEENKQYIDIICEELNLKSLNFVTVTKQEDVRLELDTLITDDLKVEGLKREIIRYTNLMRKDLGLSIKDKRLLVINSDSALIDKMINEHEKEILKETSSSKLEQSVPFDFLASKSFEIEGQEVLVYLCS